MGENFETTVGTRVLVAGKFLYMGFKKKTHSSARKHVEEQEKYFFFERSTILF